MKTSRSVGPPASLLYFVSHLAAEQVKVVLTGEGSDELFAGYGRYRFYMLNRRWMEAYRHVPRRDARLGALADRRIQPAFRKHPAQAAAFRAGARRESRSRSTSIISIAAFSSAEQQSLLTRGAPHAGIYDSYLRYWNAEPQAPLLSRMLYADQKTYLVELLMKQDQMSMACSLESRVPFLDHLFVEFAAGVPGSHEASRRRGQIHSEARRREICFRTKLSIARRWASPRRCANG